MGYLKFTNSNERPRLLGNKNLDEMPMKTTLSCQFCGSLIEICSQNFQNVTEDELWLLQANLYLWDKEKIP